MTEFFVFSLWNTGLETEFSKHRFDFHPLPSPLIGKNFRILFGPPICFICKAAFEQILGGSFFVSRDLITGLVTKGGASFSNCPVFSAILKPKGVVPQVLETGLVNKVNNEQKSYPEIAIFQKSKKH